MPVANSQGVRIHYEVEGDGSPLVLQHGFTDDLNSWYESGVVEALKRDHRLILIDARGHGASDKPHDEDAYAPELNVSDITAVLDDLHLRSSRYWGYSMGGAIGFALAECAPDRITSMVLGGASPYSAPAGTADALLDLLQRGPQALLPIYQEFMTPQKEARLLASDMQAFIAIRRRRRAHQGFGDIIHTMRMRCLLYAGSSDPIHTAVQEAAAVMPNAEFFSVPGLGHVQALYRSELVLPQVVKFLET